MQYVDKIIDMPVLKTREVPCIVNKRVEGPTVEIVKEVPQVQVVQKIVDIPRIENIAGSTRAVNLTAPAARIRSVTPTPPPQRSRSPSPMQGPGRLQNSYRPASPMTRRPVFPKYHKVSFPIDFGLCISLSNACVDGTFTIIFEAGKCISRSKIVDFQRVDCQG